MSRLTRLRGEPLEVRRLLATHGGVMENVGRDLVSLYDEFETYRASATAAPFVSTAADRLKVLGDTVMVTVRGTGDFDALLGELRASRFISTATAAAAKLIDGILPIDMLPAVAALTGTQSVVPIYAIQPGNSEGTVSNAAETTLRADLARDLFGVDGTGVIVGVIADSANRVAGGLADSISTGNLPPMNVGTFLDIDGPPGSADEGRAMMELIHDIAPGAILRFASGSSGEASFATAVNTLVNNGAKIIVDDLNGLQFEQFFIDGVASQAITTAVQTHGVTFINSVGNRGRSGYDAPVTNIGSVTFPGVGTLNAVDFDAGPGTDFTQTVTLQPGTTTFVFQHDQVWGSVATDCDFLILNAAGTQILASGQNNDIATQTAREIVSVNVSTTTNVQIVIRHFSGPAPQRFKYVGLNRPVIAEHQNEPGALVAGADSGHAGNLNGISIAAVNNATPTVPEVFSAVGPVTRVFAPDGTRLPQLEIRNKPDLTAPDGVATSVPGLTNFLGTSAAAPNAAGIAALLLSRYPALTNTQLRTVLSTGARDLLTPGYDLTTGLGLIDALGTIATVTSGALTIDGDVNAGNANDTIELRVNAADSTLLDVTINGVLVRSIARSQFDSIQVNGLTGDDKLIVDSSNGLVTVAGGIHFGGGAGVDTLELTQTGGATQSSSLYQPGPSAGAGQSVIAGAAGTQTVVFTGLEPVIDLVPAATLIVEGNAADNTVSYGAGAVAGRGRVHVDNFEFIEFANKANLTINGLEGSDTIQLGQPAVPAGLTTITIEGSDGLDALVIAGTEAADFITAPGPDEILTGGIPVTVGPTLERLQVFGLGGDDTINLVSLTVLAADIFGGEGNDAITGTPQSDLVEGQGGNDALFGGAGLDVLRGGDDNDTIDGDQGSDQMLGGSGADTFVWDPGDGSDLIEGEAGDDILRFNGAAAAEVFAFSTLGTRLRFTRSVGNIVMDAAGVEQVDLFALGGIDTVEINDVTLTELRRFNVHVGADAAVGDVVNVEGTGLADMINAARIVDPADGLTKVQVSGLSYELFIGGTEVTDDADDANDDQLQVFGNDGEDQLATSAELSAAGQASMRVAWSGGLGSDRLTFFGTPGPDDINLSPLATGEGSIAIADALRATYATNETIVIEGQGASDALKVTTPAGAAHDVTLTPGVTTGAGNIQVDSPSLGGLLASLEFANLGDNGALIFDHAGGGRTDSLTVLGTPQADGFEAFDDVVLVLWSTGAIPVFAPGVIDLNLKGLGGDDAFSINGPMPYDHGTIDGGDAADQFVVNGDSSPLFALLLSSGVQLVGGGLGVYALSSVESATFNANSGELLVSATDSDDDLTVTPTGLNSGTIQASHLPIAISFNDPSVLTIDLGDGSDRLTVAGSASGDEIEVNAFSVAIAGRETVNYQNIEALTVNAGAGADTVTVTPAANTSIFVDGGDPIGVLPGDAVNIVAGGSTVSFFAGPETDAGGFQVGINASVSFDHVETIGVFGPGQALIVGTNADDDITVIARDNSTHPQLSGLTPGTRDFTVAVNDGPELLFVNVASLYIDALAGDDDIAALTQAPNLALWDVDLFVAGGPPSSGDQLVVETPGTNAVVYTPTGANTGTLSIDGPTGGSVVTIGLFSLPLGLSGYLSSAGGIEQLIYDGSAGDDQLTVVGDGIAAGAADQFVHQPGIAADAGLFRVNNWLPLAYQNLGPASQPGVDGRLGANSLLVDGTSQADRFSIDAQGTVTIIERRPIATASIESLSLRGLDGDDAFSLFNGLPFGGVQIDGGSASAGDVLALFGDGDAQAMSVFLGLGVITGIGGAVIYGDVERINLNGQGGVDTLTVAGAADQSPIIYTPTSDSGGAFQIENAVPLFTFNIGADSGSRFTIDGDASAADRVIVRGTNNRDLVTVDAPNRTIAVQNALGVDLKPVVLGPAIEAVTVLGLLGGDTFLVTPAAATVTAPDGSPINLLIHVDGGPMSASDVLVIADIGGAALAETDFVLVSRPQTTGEGFVRVFRNSAALPDIGYAGIESVSPSVAAPDGIPNLLVLNAATNEPNDSLGAATFLGTGSTIHLANLAIFPGEGESPLTPADQDFYRIVAQQTGTLDFQVYFRQVSPGLLPQGGDLDIQVFDAAGNLIAGEGAFGNNNGPAELDADGSNERVRIPAVVGRSYFLRVFGRGEADTPNRAVNGYSLTVINALPPTPGDIALADSQATTIADDTPTIVLHLASDFFDDMPSGALPPDEIIPLPFNPSAADLAPGYRVAIFDASNTSSPTLAGYAQPLSGQPGLFSFMFADPLTQGRHFISAAVEFTDPSASSASAFGPRSASLEIVIDFTPPQVFFGAENVATDGLDAASDTGVTGQPATFSDRLTSDTTPTLSGLAEANASVRLYADQNSNGVLDIGDLLLGQTTATPRGANQSPSGQWSISSAVDLNSLGSTDGARLLFVTAEDSAGNVSAAQSLTIFIDTEGLRISAGPFVQGFAAFDLFASGAGEPTPLVTRLVIPVGELPSNANDASAYLTSLQAAATQAGQITVRGDRSGVVAVKSVTAQAAPAVNGQPATAQIIVEFFAALPDDRFTLTVSDSITDPAGNPLDGDTNATQPQFPSGDGQRGGSFSARFTVDSRPPAAIDTAALYDPATGFFFLQDENATGPAAQQFQFGPVGAGRAPLDGDWDGDGADSVGVYHPATGVFFLRNANTAGAADVQFQFGPGGIGWQPLAGDWNHDGVDTVGLYHAASGVFFLKNSNTPGPADIVFVYGAGGVGLQPVVGDWNDDGTDTVGLFVPATGSFWLRNDNAAGNAEISFEFGPGGVDWTTVIGDWDHDGDDNVGLYDPASSVYFLKDTNSPGPADRTFAFGLPGTGQIALAGMWSVAGHALRFAGAADASSSAPAIGQEEIRGALDAAVARWAIAGLYAQRVEQLRATEVIVSDLPGNLLGWAAHGVIYVDRDAAGAGWFVDATPDADEEYAASSDRLSAIDVSLAAGGVDLLTVLAHELGHELRLDDLQAEADNADLMTESLAPGQRRLPRSALLDRAFAELDD